MRVARRLAGLLILAPALVLAGAASAQDAETGPKAERAFVVQLQQALRADDVRWIADHCSYPVRVGLPGLAQVKDPRTLATNYRRIFTSALKATVLAQDPDQLFRNWQGTMIGDGAA